MHAGQFVFAQLMRFLPRHEFETCVRRYDGELRFTDSQIGALLGMLAASGVAEDTVVVVTADHGESLVEHDELLQHGWFVYEPTTRVPLVLAWPGRMAGGIVLGDELCSVDLAPTLLDIAGVKGEGGDFDGRSFAPSLGAGVSTGAVTAAPESVASLRDAGCFSIGPRANHPFALRSAAHRLILTPAGTSRDPRAAKGEGTDAPETIEVYDLASDPAESVNVAESRRDILDEMQPSLARLRSRFRANGWRW